MRDGGEVSAAKDKPKGVNQTCFSIFFRGCKLLKSVHTFISGDKDKEISEIMSIFEPYLTH